MNKVQNKPKGLIGNVKIRIAMWLYCLIASAAIMGMGGYAIAHTTKPVVDYVKHLSGSSSNDIAVDEQGNAYITGSNISGPFLAKFDPFGECSVKDIACGFESNGIVVSVATGYVFVTGTTQQETAFLGKYNSNLGLVYCEGFAPIPEAGPCFKRDEERWSSKDIAIDDSNDVVYITGGYSYRDFNTGYPGSHFLAKEPYLMRLNALDEHVVPIDVVGMGNSVTFSGGQGCTLGVGNGIDLYGPGIPWITGGNPSESFVGSVRLPEDADRLLYRSPGKAAGTSIAVDSSEEIYVTDGLAVWKGTSPQCIYIHGSQTSINRLALWEDYIYVTGSSEGNVFVAKLDKDGNEIYSTNDLIGCGEGTGIAVDVHGDVYVTGNTTGDGIFVAKIVEVEQELPIVNNMVDFKPLPGPYLTIPFTEDYPPCTCGCPDTSVAFFGFGAELHNKSCTSLTDLTVKVRTLTNENLLLLARGGETSPEDYAGAETGGEGVLWTLPLPPSGSYSDGTLGPDEYTIVVFAICLEERVPFRFYVDLLGEMQ